MTLEQLLAKLYGYSAEEGAVDAGGENDSEGVTGEEVEPEQDSGDNNDAGVDNEAIAALKAALKKERQQRREYELKLKTQEEKLHSVDLEEYERLKAEREAEETRVQELKRKKLEEQQKYDELIKLEKERADQLERDLSARLSEKDRKMQELEQNLQTDIARRNFTNAWLENGGNPDMLDVMFNSLSPQLRVDPTKNTTSVLGSDGETVQLDELGDPVTVTNWVGDVVKKKYPSAFVFQGKGGTSAPPSNNGKPRSSSKISWEESLKMSAADIARMQAKK